MPCIAKNRVEMISSLIEQSADAAAADARHYGTKELFDREFVGYNKSCDVPFLVDMHVRGLFSPDDSFDDDAWGDSSSDLLFN